jgi:plastocyanin
MRIRAAAPLAALALALAACGGGSSGGSSLGSTSGGSDNSIGGVKANIHGTADVTGMSSVDITASNYNFSPSVLKGTPGQQLTLHVVNSTGTEHNVTIDSQHVNTDLDGHDKADVKVTMPATGVLAFWCEYHKSLGMVGGLLVSGSVGDGTAPSSSPDDSGGGGYGGYGNGNG